MSVDPSVTPAQLAVLAACMEQERVSYTPVSAECWFRAGPPFRGDKRAFSRQLRVLAGKGLLFRRSGSAASYAVTVRGQRLAVFVGRGETTS